MPEDKYRDGRDSKRGRSRDRDRDRKRERSREKRRSRERRSSRDREKEERRKKEQREKEREKREKREREDKERARILEEEQRRQKEELRLAEEEAELCERDKRTVFVYHLHPKVDSKVLVEFFNKAGKVRDVRLITDKKTGKSKGFGYIEFYDPSAVVGALAMQGYELMGHAVMVKVSEAEKNVVTPVSGAGGGIVLGQGATRLYVGNLHPKITDGDLKMVFSELGAVEKCEVPTDPATGQGRGYAYLKFKIADDAKKALVQLNGVELAGQKIKVGLVNESDDPADRLEDGSLNAQSRAILMQKLQGGAPAGLPALLGLPATPTAHSAALAALLGQPAAPLLALGAPGLPTAAAPPPPPLPVAPVEDLTPSPCLLLMNLFDPAEETEPDFDEDIKEDVAEECNKHGRLLHVWVDKASPGWVYLKFDGADGSKRTYDNLHRRWFAKRMIAARFIPEAQYREKFGL